MQQSVGYKAVIRGKQCASDISVGFDAQKLDLQCISRFGSLDKDRAKHRISALGRMIFKTSAR